MKIKQLTGSYVFTLEPREMGKLHTMKRDYILSKMLLAHEEIKGVTFNKNHIFIYLEPEDDSAMELLKWISAKIQEALI